MGNKRQGIAREPLWYKDALIYQLHVRSFSDSNADGIGDFAGLTTKLDYLQDLGVTAVWVMPFYPSPLKDDGYDIADYYKINPIYGTLEEFQGFLDGAHQRGLRVITELVINHTSDQHGWFQKSRRAMARRATKAAHPDDVYAEFYVWTHDPTRYKEVRIIFKDFEPSNWTWDPIAQAYYWHRFFSHQPDLNFDNLRVHEEIFRIIDYWCDMGVDGFRLDAIPYLYEREGTSGESLPETHAFLKKLRAHVDQKYGDRVFLAEANQWPEEAVTYFGQGQGDECHMAFHFPVMPRLFMAVRMEDRVPIVDILEQTPPLPETAQWAIFLRNHDELTLEMVTDEERDYMYRVYASESKARINLGIRRRLAPLLGNDRKKIELLNMLLLSLPGTPVLYYGDEIGMGDNIYLGDRNGVRTPMHWSSDKNAGFSRASPQALQLPIIIDPEYHYEAVNVETQQRNPHSLMWWTKRVLALRKKWKAFSRGAIEFLQPRNRKVIVFLRRHESETILVVANLSRFPQPVELDLASFAGIRPRELFGRTRFPAITEAPYTITLSPHAAFWFALERTAESTVTRADAPNIMVETGWRDVVDGGLRGVMEAALPDYLRQQRWFAGRGREIDSVMVSDVVTQADNLSLALVEVRYVGAEAETYFIPLGFAPAARAETPPAGLLNRVIAEVRGGAAGIIYDASVSESFAGPLLQSAASNWRAAGQRGEFLAWSAATLPLQPGNISMRNDHNNSIFAIDDRLFVKLFRRVEPGLNPELEMTRFLTGHGFQHVPQFVAALDYRRESELLQLGLVTQLVPNAVTGWKAALDGLSRFFERVHSLSPETPAPKVTEGVLALSQATMSQDVGQLLGAFAEVIRLLGQRTGEMHAVLASDSEEVAFAPEPFTPFYQRSLYQSMRNRTVEVFDALKQQLAELPESARVLATSVAAQQSAILARLRAIHQAPIQAQRIRIHGDYHLAQVLYTGKDHVIIDFEGEWSRPMSERRIKRSPLRDVVGMIRSFHYNAEYGLRGEYDRGQIGAEQIEKFQSWVQFRAQWMSAVFLGGYLKAVASTNLLPKDASQLETLVNAFLLDRAVAELGHELSNRPEMVHIPLRGILGLLATE